MQTKSLFSIYYNFHSEKSIILMIGTTFQSILLLQKMWWEDLFLLARFFPYLANIVLSPENIIDGYLSYG
jgi:hypothetical protein